MVEEWTTIEAEPYPDDWLARIKPELAQGERLLWAGLSNARWEAGNGIVPFVWMIGFCVLSAITFAGASGFFGPGVKELQGALASICLVSVVIAFLFVVSFVAKAASFGIERRHLKKRLYALTTQRAIMWIPSGRGVSVQSIFKGSVKRVHRIEYKDGSGSVIFQSRAAHAGLEESFQFVPDVRRVEELAKRVLIDSAEEIPRSVAS